MSDDDSALESYLDLVPTGVHSVLSHPDVKRAIALEIKAKKKDGIVLTKESLENLAGSYLDSIIPHNDFPAHSLLYIPLWFCTKRQFEKVIISKEDVEKLKKASGGVAFASTHFSLFDVSIIPYVFRSNGIRNEPVYIGGVNLMNLGESLPSRIMKYLISNSNTSFIDRVPEEAPIVAGEIVKHYFEYLLKSGSNIVYFGSANGCDKRGIVESRKSALLDVVDKVIPVTVTYEIIPEGEDYAERMSSNEKHAGRSFNDGFNMLGLTPRHGAVYVKVGEEIAGKKGKKLDEAIVQGLQNLITITPTNLFATAVFDMATSVTRGDTYLAVNNRIYQLVEDAKKRGLPISEDIQGFKNLIDISDSVMKSVFEAYVKFHPTYIEIKNKELLAIYSNMISHYFNRRPLFL